MSSPKGGGKYGPLHEAHTRIKAEMDDAATRKALRNSPKLQEIKDAALEVNDKGMARVLWATTPAKVPDTSKVTTMATDPKQEATPSKPQKAPIASEPKAQRPGRSTHVRRHIVEGLGPGGNEIHTVSGSLRAVRVQSERPTASKGTARQNALRRAADRLFEKNASQEKADPEKAATGSTEKDGGKDIER